MCRPHPRKLLAALLFPSLLPLPSSQQCTIDSSFQLAAKAWRNWIMKWSCGEKKTNQKTKNPTTKQNKKQQQQNPQRGSFHAKQPKTLPGFTSSGTCRSQNTSPLQLLPAHPWPKSAHLHYSPPKSGSLHATTIPSRVRVLTAATSGKKSSCGVQIKRVFAFSSCASAPWEEIHAIPNNV